MNYYRHFAAQTLAEGVRSPFIYLVSFLFSLVGVLLLRNLDGASLEPKMMEFISMALVFNGLAFLGYASIFLYAQRVFFQEKKARTLTMTLCSPASLGEVFWGKVAGLVTGAFIVPTLVMLAAAAVFAPRALLELASWKMAAALGIVLAAQIIYAAVSGMFMLSTRDERSVSVVLYCFGGAQVFLTALTKTAAGQTMFRGIVFQYAVITAVLGLLTAAAYYLYFSKMRVLESA
ncbi:MAG TPA: hypothetical protein DEQ38_07205 [Elusimicrobia bacterium]|nr:MAG: hypothetical protein A2089_08065 [Elusimicrobia bacterium GWD2_63_28]HCC47887.1 hypothetical protein [Elusimicrobiota bacterium]